MTYDAPLVRNILSPNSGTLLIGAPSSGLSSLAAYLAVALASGSKFFGQPAKQSPVALFGDGHAFRYIEAARTVTAGDCSNLHDTCAGCGPVNGSIVERVSGNFEYSFNTIKNFSGGVVIYDSVEEALKPEDRLSPALIVEAASAIIADSIGAEFSLVATLHASPRDVIDGCLNRLCLMFDRIIHCELIGASGRITVIRDRLGPSGFRATYDLIMPEIGLDSEGLTVRGAPIFPDDTVIAGSMAA